MSEQLAHDELYRRLEGFEVAMLTTVAADGRIHSRPMMMQRSAPGADLCFVSALNTEKIAEIRQHPQVGVIGFRDADNSYVSLAGIARVENDRERIRALWQDRWRAWFPDGPEQADLCLIAVKPQEAEYWEPRSGRLRVSFAGAGEAKHGTTPRP